MKAFFQKIIAMFLALLAVLGINLKSDELTDTSMHLSDNDSYSVDGGAVTFAFEANATTGYCWEVQQ